VLKLREYFQQVTVNKKRNHNQKRKPKKRDFTDEDMCIGLLALSILGISRISQITERLSNETQLAKLLSLPRFFSQATAHQYLNRFSQWHVSQLDSINHQLIKRHGNCTSQPIVVVDVDSQTHTLESRKREGAVVGYNRKKRGKPCYQWNVAFVCSEAVAQRLRAGNTHCRSALLELLEEVDQKLDHPFLKTWPSIFQPKGFTTSIIVGKPSNSFSKNQMDRFQQVKCLLRNFKPTRLIFSSQPSLKTACSGLKKTVA
jgi:hypothetical protein